LTKSSYQMHYPFNILFVTDFHAGKCRAKWVDIFLSYNSASWSDKLSSYLNKEVTVRSGKLKMQLWDSMCWSHVNPVPCGAVGKDCQRRLISRPRFVRVCSATDKNNLNNFSCQETVLEGNIIFWKCPKIYQSNLIQFNSVYNKMCSRVTLWFLKTSKSLQTTLAAEAHLAEGQFLTVGQT
jgi:hypothetical protein